jgi:hypothetical protein
MSVVVACGVRTGSLSPQSRFRLSVPILMMSNLNCAMVSTV